MIYDMWLAIREVWIRRWILRDWYDIKNEHRNRYGR